MKAIRGPRHFIWEMDLFPDAFVALGALSANGLATRLLGWIEDRTRSHSDGIIVLGPCMRSRLLSRGTPGHLIHVAENWADGSVIVPLPNRAAGPLNILYSGNLGLSHDIDTIAAAMLHFRNDARFAFVFAGGGVGRAKIEQLCETHGIGNARFLPYAERDHMNVHLAQADIGLVTEHTACVGTVVPSKLYALMAAGRPVLFIGPRQATPGTVVNRFQCGWQVNPGDLPALVTLLERLSAHRGEIAAYGARARAAFEKHYDRPRGVARVAAAMGLPLSGFAVSEGDSLSVASPTLRIV
jgi:glycosyltransferase involved in cell wall biosynthesis